jgi:hypothetical protein
VKELDEREFRKVLSKEELEERAIIVPVKITDIKILEKLLILAEEMDKSFDEIAKIALEKLFYDINVVHSLRKKL